MNSLKDIKALTFDVFGTVVDWRATVTRTLIQNASNKLSSTSQSDSLSESIHLQLSKLTDSDWALFAQEWRNSYKIFTKTFVPGETEWRDIDTHHYLSLKDLLKKWQLEDLYTEDEIKDLSRIWHFLDPWTDSSAGLKMLGGKFITSTLSNGNRSLLGDLNAHGNLGFQKLLSAEDFEAYKPSELVYKGAAKALGVQTEKGEIGLVAAHLGDLKAARSCGFRTIYVERKEEEDWKKEGEDYTKAKEWVDMWVREDEGGFVEVARRFEAS